MITWKKGENAPLGKHFRTKEFTCSCGCVESKIEEELISRLDKVREELGMPLIITSGYRCENKQALLLASNPGAAKISQHVLGKAADVRCSDLSKLYVILEKHFKSIGDGTNKGFYHVDLRDDKVRRWLY